MPGPEPITAAIGEPLEEPEPPRGISLDIVLEAGDWPSVSEVEATLAPVLSTAAAHPALAIWLPSTACLALGDDALMQRLNKSYRAKDKPTNVLSFPADRRLREASPAMLGDIVLGFETVMREAKESSVSTADHIRHLLLHGLLHLMEYDHETDADANVMEALEIEILASLGIASPYDEAAPAPAKS